MLWLCHTFSATLQIMNHDIRIYRRLYLIKCMILGKSKESPEKTNISMGELIHRTFRVFEGNDELVKVCVFSRLFICLLSFTFLSQIQLLSFKIMNGLLFTLIILPFIILFESFFSCSGV